MEVPADLACKINETHKPPYHDKVLTTGAKMYNAFYRDVSNVSDELMEKCRLHHPQSELLIEERII